MVAHSRVVLRWGYSELILEVCTRVVINVQREELMRDAWFLLNLVIACIVSDYVLVYRVCAHACVMQAVRDVYCV